MEWEEEWVEVCNKKIKDGKEYILRNGKWIRNLDETLIIELYEKEKSVVKVAKLVKADGSVIKRILKENGKELLSHREAVTHAMSNPSIRKKLSESYYKAQEKRKTTCLRKYGVEYASQTEEFQQKVRETSKKRYNSSHFLGSEIVKHKRKKTCNIKYDVDNVSQVPFVKEKRIETIQKKYGVNYPFQSEEVKDKIKQYFQKKYGVENPSQVEEFKQKREVTMLEKYGETNIMRTRKMQSYFSEKRKQIFLRKLPVILNRLDLELLEEYEHAHFKHHWKCTKCNFEFKQFWNVIQQGFTCPKCFPRLTGKSKTEDEIRNFLDSITKEKIFEHARDVIPPKELDFFIPSKNIAIEYNGLYWHNDKRISKDYHLEKTISCMKKEIRLIHIFEDEWLFKNDIVKSRLEYLLGSTQKERVHARKCSIRVIDTRTKNKFLDMFHLQGHDISRIKLGAFYNDTLIAVMTFSYGNIAKGSKKEEGVWELNRFCSDYNYRIPGIASKMLKFFEKNYSWKKIYSYADLRWSNGNVYYQLGFSLEKLTQPNYWYLKDCQRVHRFLLRKTPDEPKEISEWVLRREQGYFRIWDCGHLKFVKANRG